MLNKELSEMREQFIKKHNLKCADCAYWERHKKGKCASKVYCIVRDNVFNSNYKEKEGEEK